MDILKTFVFEQTAYEVDIRVDNDGEKLFKVNDIAKILGMTNVKESISEFGERERRPLVTKTEGGDQTATFLTDRGVYKLLFRSRKSIAKPFMEWVLDVLKSIEQSGKYELEEEIEKLKSEHSSGLRTYMDEEDARASKKITKGYDKKPLVYFGKIKTLEDDRMLIKIGCTKDIKQRAVGLDWEFGGMAILEVFECDRHDDFEKWLHQHVDIRRYQYKDIVNNIKRSSEVFLFDKVELERALNIATRNVFTYRNNSDKRGLDESIEGNPVVKRLCHAVGIESPIRDDPEEVVYSSKRGICTNLGRKIQCYDKDKNLLETYDKIIDVLRDNSMNVTRSGLTRACEDRTLYKGCRWAYLPRESRDDMIQEIGETVTPYVLRTGHVALVNADKTKVVDVYTSFLHVSRSHGLKSTGAVTKRMKKGHLLDNCYIVPWVDVCEDMQDAWLDENKLPALPRSTSSKPVNRLDPTTKNVLKTYSTMDEVKTKFGITARTLKGAIAGNNVRSGFLWSYAEASSAKFVVEKYLEQ